MTQNSLLVCVLLIGASCGGQVQTTDGLVADGGAGGPSLVDAAQDISVGGAAGTNANTGGTGGAGGDASMAGSGNTAGGGAGGTPNTGGAGGSSGDASTGGSGNAAGTGGDGGMAGQGGAGGPACAAPTEMVKATQFPDKIDLTEVTRCQYEAWLATSPSTAGQDSWCAGNKTFFPNTGCMLNACKGPGCELRPQVCIDWCDAFAYCRAHGKSLCGKIGGGPTPFAQGFQNPGVSLWQYACTSAGKNVYPYGGEFDPQKCNGADYDAGAPVDVGTLKDCRSFEDIPAYQLIHDMSGNVEEWENSCDGTNDMFDSCRLRGGSFADDAAGLRCSRDHSLLRETRFWRIGFRCCMH